MIVPSSASWGSGTSPGARLAASTSGPSASIGVPAREVRGRGRHDVAARRTSGPAPRSWYSRILEGDDPHGPAEHRDGRREQAVVGADEEPALDLDRDAAPLGADAGIDDREDDPVGQVLHRPHQRERAGRGRRTGGRRG